MKSIALLITLYVLFPGNSPGQKMTFTPQPGEPMFVVPGDDEKDPAYKTYKEGYALVLGDKWSDAIKAFGEVRTKFPKSEYLDDAAYWSAYAQKRLDRKKGLAAYEKFLADFPESSYFDDALADMEDDLNVVVSGDAKNVRVARAPGAYSYSYGSTIGESRKAMRDAQRAMWQVKREMREAGVRMPRPPMAPVGFSSRSAKNLDPQTRIKLDALRALGESGNDKEAFATLKEIALDKSQTELMRMTALQSLGDFRKFDILPLLIDIAKSDASQDIQIIAISTISDATTDKNKSADALVTLFNSFPKQKEQQLQTTLYAIADIGNDKAVDFLVRVATTNDNYDLRSDAVYYLGSIGNEKSRSALMQILKSK